MLLYVLIADNQYIFYLYAIIASFTTNNNYQPASILLRDMFDIVLANAEKYWYLPPICRTPVEQNGYHTHKMDIFYPKP